MRYLVPNHSIDWSMLTARDVLDIAAYVECEAQERYELHRDEISHLLMLHEMRKSLSVPGTDWVY